MMAGLEASYNLCHGMTGKFYYYNCYYYYKMYGLCMLTSRGSISGGRA